MEIKLDDGGEVEEKEDAKKKARERSSRESPIKSKRLDLESYWGWRRWELIGILINAEPELDSSVSLFCVAMRLTNAEWETS